MLEQYSYNLIPITIFLNIDTVCDDSEISDKIWRHRCLKISEEKYYKYLCDTKFKLVPVLLEIINWKVAIVEAYNI